MLRTKIILKPFWSQLEISFRIHSYIFPIYLFRILKFMKCTKNILSKHIIISYNIMDVFLTS